MYGACLDLFSKWSIFPSYLKHIFTSYWSQEHLAQFHQADRHSST